tara:strand:- start:43 stop:1245 length:1203 start_codon:yes stop_codon:yes gene_type:complete
MGNYPKLRNNTWKLNQWYDQSVAGTQGDFINKTYQLWAWGENPGGSLGQNNNTTYSSPRQIPGNWVEASIGTGFKISDTAGVDAYVWGQNNYGQLGDGTTTSRSSPIQLPGSWKSLQIHDHSLGIKSDGTLWSWGSGNKGQQGHGDVSNRVLPKKLGTATNWSKLASNGPSGSSAAIKTDGTLWMMGSNSQGQLSQNNIVQYSSPVQIPGTTWKSVALGQAHSFATKTDGTAWAWGFNEYGQMGQGNNTKYSSPVQIPGTDWDTVVPNNSNTGSFWRGYSTVLKKNNDSVYYAGMDSSGAMGMNVKDNSSIRNTMTELGNGTSWSGWAGALNSGTGFTFNHFGSMSWGVKTNGQLWASGNGKAFEDDTIRSSPYQIPGTWSTDAGVSGAHSTQMGCLRDT